MGGRIVQCDGEFVTMPFDGDWSVPTLEGRFPNAVMLDMDEARFKSGFVPHAIWTLGKGEFASLSYCGQGLTIQRYPTLEAAIWAKRTIDGSGCGGGCVKVHFIIHIDPTNSRAAQEQENIRKYKAQRSSPEVGT
jgi:hypothetical protein